MATIYADSSAALAVAARRGSGKLRHINVGLLWVQEKNRQKELRFEKVLGTENPADAMTKGVKREVLDKHTKAMQQVFPAGRASKGLQVQGGGGGVGGGGVVARLEALHKHH